MLYSNMKNTLINSYPNSSSTIENNINSIIPETDVIDDSYKFLIPDDNTEMNNYDLQQDLKIQKYNYIDSIQKNQTY